MEEDEEVVLEEDSLAQKKEALEEHRKECAKQE